MFISGHKEANRGKSKAQLPLEPIFGFCKTFEKVTKNLGFPVNFQTANLQVIFYTTIADGTKIFVTINSLYIYVPFFIPNTETQLMFNKSIQSSYRMFLDEWYTERRIVSDTVTQFDIGNAQSVKSPKYLIAAHQTYDRLNGHNKRDNILNFDDLNVRKYFVEIDGVRYPRDSVLVNYGENGYFDQCGDPKIFFREYFGEEILTFFISYRDMKSKYPIQVIDLKFQVDHITPKKTQLFEEYRDEPANNPNNARFFIILIRRREIELISDENKLIEVHVFYMKILNLKGFMKIYNLKNDTTNESEIQRVYNYYIYPRDSKTHSSKGFVNIDNGSQSGSHWTCFIGKDNKSYSDKFVLNQLPKPKIFHNHKMQVSNSKLCVSYCLYFFYSIERMKYYDTILKMCFG